MTPTDISNASSEAEEMNSSSHLQYSRIHDDEVEHLYNLLDHCNEAIFQVHVPSGIISYANRSASSLLGYSLSELVKMNFCDLIADTDAAAEMKKILLGETISNNANIRTFLNKHGSDMVTVETNLSLYVLGGETVAVVVSTDATQQHDENVALREINNKFLTLVEKGNDGVVIIQDGSVIFANRKMEELLSYSTDEAIGRPLLDFISPPFKEAVLKNYHKRITGLDVPDKLEIHLFSKNHEDIPVEVHACRIEHRGRPAFMYIIRDITQLKGAENEMKKRLMKFRLENGNIYLVKESLPTLSLAAFKDLINVGYHGFVLSRTPVEDFNKFVEGMVFEFMWLAEINDEKAIFPSIEDIERQLLQRLEKGVIGKALLIDRLEYLIFKNGFNKVLAFVQHLKEVAYLTGCVIILTIDPSTLEHTQLRLLEKETGEVDHLYQTQLPEDLSGILTFTYRRNSIGMKPSYTDVGHELGISKPTVRKRIKRLIYTGYLIDSIKGRNKVLELTEKGRSLFLR